MHFKRAFGLAFLLTLTTAYAGTTNGLVAYFPFSGNAQDATLSSNDGTVKGATLTKDRYGNPNQAYHFNGTNQYIVVGHRITSSEPFSWAVWFRPDFSATTVGGSLVTQGAPVPQNSPSLGINLWEPRGTGTIGFYTYDSVGRLMFSKTRSSWDTNSWYHVAITSDAQGNRALFMNGSLEGTATSFPFGQQNTNFFIGLEEAEIDKLLEDL